MHLTWRMCSGQHTWPCNARVTAAPQTRWTLSAASRYAWLSLGALVWLYRNYGSER